MLVSFLLALCKIKTYVVFLIELGNMQEKLLIFTAQKVKFLVEDFFSKREQICSFLRICSHLVKKSSTE